MKVIKKILIGFGVLFVLFIVFAVFLVGGSSDFKSKNEQFVKGYTHSFSQSWDINSVSNVSTTDFLSEINTPNGQHALNFFRSLGKVIEIKDMELKNYTSHSSGITAGVFIFKATFKNADALITVTAQEKDNIVKVQSFHVAPLSSVTKSKEIDL